MNKSEAIGQLAAALAKAQGDYKALPKDAKGYDYAYAKLDAYHTAIQTAFAPHQLSYIQSIETGDDAVRAVTLVMHESGEWIQGDGPWVPWTIKRNAAQDVGSATTYAKRYSLGTVAGIESEDDDGASQNAEKGQTAEKPKTQAKRAAKRPAPDPEPAPSPHSVASLTQAINNAKDDKTLKTAGAQIGEFLALTENMRFGDELRASYKARLDGLAAIKDELAA